MGRQIELYMTEEDEIELVAFAGSEVDDEYVRK